jgi:peptidylprolyl isomerase
MVKIGDTVKVHYKGTLSDGSQFDSSEGRAPLEFKVGEHAVIQGFENAVNGMEIRQTKTVTIPAEEAYGPRRDEMMIAIGKDRLPPGLDPNIGDQLQMRNQNGQATIVTVAKKAATSLTLVPTTPLAGKEPDLEINLWK